METAFSIKNIQPTNEKTGLSPDQVQASKVQDKKPFSPKLALALEVLKNQVTSIFFILLLLSGGISWFLGEKTDAYILFGINALNVVLGFLQEFRAGSAAQKLASLVSVQAKVKRNGTLQTIPASELVVGDIVHLVAGDVIPADIWVRVEESAQIDESIRTGESLPIQPKIDSQAFAGTSLVMGEIVGQVIAIGAGSSLGSYQQKLQNVKKDNSFQNFVQKTSRTILVVTLISLLVSMIVSVVVFQKFSFPQFLVFAIAMLVGVVPEALPLIITAILTRHSLILSKYKVIVKRLASLQELGSIKFLLTDKTGTLTENKLMVAATKDLENLQKVASTIAWSQYDQSPMDVIFDSALQNFYPHKNQVQFDDFTPFNHEIGYALFKSDDLTIIRGQYAAISTICDNHELDPYYQEMESSGLRVIAFASKNGTDNFRLNGLVAFSDPLKSDAKDTIEQARLQNLQVKIITGDSEKVARYVAKQVGFGEDRAKVVDLQATGISELSDQQLEYIEVFAKCTPDDKLALIERYLKLGSVGFLGEGINDALALKKSDVGLVVNNASDVARQAADILLLEPGLTPILQGVVMGRRAFASVITYLLCTLTGNAGTFFSLLMISLFWKDLPMLPIQILLNNLLTDIPLIFLITDHISQSVLQKPSNYQPRQLLTKVLIFGLVSTIFDFAYFWLFYTQDLGILRTGWFMFSVYAELILIFALRSDLNVFQAPRLSKPLTFAMIAAATLTLLLVSLPIGGWFEFLPLDSVQLSMIFGILTGYFFANDLVKRWINWRKLSLAGE